MNKSNDDVCDCEDCEANEQPCEFDCDLGEACRGCVERAADEAEFKYNIGLEQGR